jgi:hypothetical protein
MRHLFAAAARGMLAPLASSPHGHPLSLFLRPQAQFRWSSTRALTTANQCRSKNMRRWLAAALSAAAAAGASAFLLAQVTGSQCSPQEPSTAAPDAVLSTLPQMLSHISRRRNVRASSGSDGAVVWLQPDFSGKDQLFSCDALAFESCAAPQAVMLTQLEGGVKLMELVPDVDEYSSDQELRGRVAVVAEGSDGDALHLVHLPSGSSSHNLLPPAHRVTSIISSPARPEHLLLIMRSTSSASPADDVFLLDLTTRRLALHARNPGFVSQWAADLSTLTVRACVCSHSPLHSSAPVPSYVKARGRGGAGPWVHVCELPHGGSVAGFSDAGSSIVVMNRASAADVNYIAEKHVLSPILSGDSKRQRSVLSSSATGQAVALQV